MCGVFCQAVPFTDKCLIYSFWRPSINLYFIGSETAGVGINACHGNHSFLCIDLSLSIHPYTALPINPKGTEICEPPGDANNFCFLFMWSLLTPITGTYGYGSKNSNLEISMKRCSIKQHFQEVLLVDLSTSLDTIEIWGESSMKLVC